MADLRSLLHTTADVIGDYREALADAPVYPRPDWEHAGGGFDRPLPAEPTNPAEVVEALVAAAGPGLVASAGPRYFGFVTGGSLDAALCADLLAVGWDQLAFNHVSSPASIACERVAGRWLKEVLGLPSGATVGFVTGGQAANTVLLAAARWRVLQQVGWDVEQDGLFGAPRIRVLVGAERHATIDRALRLLGLGEACVEPLPVDHQGALDASATEDALAADPSAPTIVCAQAGNVNSGAYDDIARLAPAARAAGAWLHVDGAFGLWAAASPARRHLVEGLEHASSWGCDGHKWLNVPYDSGYAICADPEAHVASMRYTASYLTGQDAGAASGADLTPESSRRSRGFATWAALLSLGRDGVADLVDRCCDLATRLADGAGRIPGVEVRNDVVLNQVLLAVPHPDATAARLQEGGTAWMGATTWRGERLLRIAVSNWSTTTDDIDRVVDAIARAVGAAR